LALTSCLTASKLIPLRRASIVEATATARERLPLSAAEDRLAAAQRAQVFGGHVKKEARRSAYIIEVKRRARSESLWLPAWLHMGTNFCRRDLARGMVDAFATKEISMDWNWVEGNWKEIKGKARQAWGKLTDDDLDKIAGKREELEGMIQKRYGVSKDLAQKDVEDWLMKVR
jgi:uncharacterized protein YjbJ (UPF0337 family)